MFWESRCNWSSQPTRLTHLWFSGVCMPCLMTEMPGMQMRPANPKLRTVSACAGVDAGIVIWVESVKAHTIRKFLDKEWNKKIVLFFLFSVQICSTKQKNDISPQGLNPMFCRKNAISLLLKAKNNTAWKTGPGTEGKQFHFSSTMVWLRQVPRECNVNLSFCMSSS